MCALRRYMIMASKTVSSPAIANPRISPKYRADDWKALNLSDPKSPDWSTAIDIFRDRIHGRFLAPVDAIANHTDCQIQEFSGFTIIAIDCLLIETLNQFYQGIDETVGSHGDAFWNFFRESTHFQREFDTKRKATI